MDDGARGERTAVAAEGLDPSDAPLVHALAVTGGRATLADLAVIADVTLGEVEAGLVRLARQGLVDGGPAPRLHPRAVALAEATPSPMTRAVVAARAARRWRDRPGYESETVAALEGSIPLGEAWAARLLAKAAERAWAAGETGACGRLAERALAEGVDEVEVWAAATALTARALLADLDVDPAAAMLQVEAIIERLTEADRTRETVDIRLALIVYAVIQGRRPDLAAMHADRIPCDLVDAAEQPDLGLTWRAQTLRGYLGATYFHPSARPPGRMDLLASAHDVLVSDLREALPARGMAAAAYAQAGEDDVAATLADALLPEITAANAEFFAEIGVIGVVYAQLGRFAEARDVFERIGSIAAAIRREDQVVSANAWLGFTDLWLGDLASARARADRAWAAAPLWPVFTPLVAALRAEVALYVGEEADLESALDLGELSDLVTTQPGISGATWWVTRARVELALGRPDAARTSLDCAARSYELSDWVAPREPVELMWRHLARSTVGPPTPCSHARPVMDAWIAALGIEPTAPTIPDAICELLPPLRLAEVRLHHAGRLRRAGRRGDARAMLHQVIDDAERLGATRLVAVGLHELHAADGRRRRDPGEHLTPAEQRVAELAATGAGNQAVAARLSLSVKTVETHMSRVLAKSGVRRGDLASWLAARASDSAPPTDSPGGTQAPRVNRTRTTS
ncbi:helix-turn-helix transcriptional regulator [Nocardioides sp. R-C-SC26]|uniref:helix-turn-helix transcriptional regulator n=1 Tax=Nocardioides sp. R-C-SC26 TaxID=2870414 RepID=UPI001E3E76EA|nr:helix-turn-helix transcriptional regulator [Nocardioides sp. R-C-SC26]